MEKIVIDHGETSSVAKSKACFTASKKFKDPPFLRAIVNQRPWVVAGCLQGWLGWGISVQTLVKSSCWLMNGWMARVSSEHGSRVTRPVPKWLLVFCDSAGNKKPAEVWEWQKKTCLKPDNWITKTAVKTRATTSCSMWDNQFEKECRRVGGQRQRGRTRQDRCGYVESEGEKVLFSDESTRTGIDIFSMKLGTWWIFV